MSIAADVRAWLAMALPALPAITEDNFAPTSAALMVRGDPSQANVIEFVDGSYQGSQQLSFYAKSKEPATAQAQLESIQAALDKKEIALTGLQVIRVRSVSTVSFVAKEDTGESIYTFTAAVEYDGKNPYGG